MHFWVYNRDQWINYTDLCMSVPRLTVSRHVHIDCPLKFPTIPEISYNSIRQKTNLYNRPFLYMSKISIYVALMAKAIRWMLPKLIRITCKSFIIQNVSLFTCNILYFFRYAVWNDFISYEYGFMQETTVIRLRNNMLRNRVAPKRIKFKYW